MNEWYTQKEVAERLGVSKATVYHRLHREARYYKE